jgi:hypothetical protein
MRRLTTILILAISLTLGTTGGRAALPLTAGNPDCVHQPVADGCDHARHRAKPVPMACGALVCCATLTVLPADLPTSARSDPGLRLSKILPPRLAHRTAISATDPPIPRH